MGAYELVVCRMLDPYSKGRNGPEAALNWRSEPIPLPGELRNCPEAGDQERQSPKAASFGTTRQRKAPLCGGATNLDILSTGQPSSHSEPATQSSGPDASLMFPPLTDDE